MLWREWRFQIIQENAFEQKKKPGLKFSHVLGLVSFSKQLGPGYYSCQPHNVLHFLQNFFEALERVKEIHNDCKVLLRTKQQTAGWVQ